VKTDAPAETRVASKKVDDGLDDFFNIPAKSNTSSAAPAVSAVKKEVEPEVFSQPKASEAFGSATRKSLNDLDSKVAVAAPKKAGASFDNFDFGNSFSQANEQAKSNQAKSIVSVEPVETPSNSVSVKTQANSGQEISGNLEPVASGLSGSADGSGTRSTSLRKFKITNPKETSLAVTLSVRGKKITLQPDQTFVVSDSDDIKVTFSRGGSFGFENQTLKAGHYRFSVTREAGWKLSN